MLAYLDSITYGLVPCRVLSMTDQGGLFIEYTATHGPYEKGLHDIWSKRQVVPRDSVIGLRRISGPRILPYDWSAYL